MDQPVTLTKVDLCGAINCIHLFKPLMTLGPEFDVDHMSSLANKGVEPEDIFALSSFFGRCLTDKHIRLAVKDVKFLKGAVDLLKIRAEDYVEKKSAVIIEEEYKTRVGQLFGDEDHRDELAVKHAEKAMWKDYNKMVKAVEKC